MPRPGEAPRRRRFDLEYPRLLERACALADQNRQSILALNAIRERAEAALRQAEEVLRRANARLNVASEHLDIARGRRDERRAAAGSR